MRSSSPLISKIVASALAIALVCWLVGAGSRNCCAQSDTVSSIEDWVMHQDASVSTAEASEPHCAQPDHCRKAESARQATSFVSSCATHSQLIGAMSCCALLAHAFDSPRKARLVPECLVAVSKDAQPRPPFDSTSNGLLNSKSFLPDSGETYLRDCVFLI